MVAWQDNFYSQMVAWMKIILPLAALALLSTLFLISRSVDPTKAIPVVELDLEQRAQDQGATNAAFAGVTQGGDEIMLAAVSARPSPTNNQIILATDISAELRLLSGTVIDVMSDSADMNQTKNTASLEGEVRIMTTTGYDIASDRLEADFNMLHLESPGPVSGEGPPGMLTAGRMILTNNEETGTAHLVFTDGVKLIYTGHISED